MGSVWRAAHLTLRAEVAVKIIDPTIATHELGLPRFLREARALAALHSPYIVQVIDFGTHEEMAYLVMELLEGKTLGQRLKAEGKLSAAETYRILGDVCKAMAHAHDRGIVHRDLKPDNIFLCDGSREHVTKVLDFGIAKPTTLDAASNVDTGAGAFLGTPSYMSPEQCRGLKLDHRSDLWSIAAIAYECLLGKRLFLGDAVGDVIVRICTGDLPHVSETGDLPPGFASWLSKAMARDPGDRFQAAPELFSALASVLDGARSSTLGVDSAVTLSEAPASAQEPAAGPSTLASGSLEKTARRPRELKPAPGLRIAAGGALVALVLAAILLLRDRTSVGLAQGEGPRTGELAAPERAGPLPAAGGAPLPAAGGTPLPAAGGAPLLQPDDEALDPGGRLDAGVAVTPSSVTPSAVTPSAVTRGKPPSGSAVDRAPAKAAKRVPARRNTLYEMERLRKNR
jgi:eukaryotic-like serine/threonine-protein kinase